MVNHPLLLFSAAASSLGFSNIFIDSVAFASLPSHSSASVVSARSEALRHQVSLLIQTGEGQVVSYLTFKVMMTR